MELPHPPANNGPYRFLRANAEKLLKHKMGVAGCTKTGGWQFTHSVTTVHACHFNMQWRPQSFPEPWAELTIFHVQATCL